MFKKKKIESNKETNEVKDGPQLYDDRVICAAIKCLKDALATGQIRHGHCRDGDGSVLLVVPKSYISMNKSEFVCVINNYYPVPLLDQMEIISMEQIEKEVRESKQKELERLQACQAKDLAEIERLARELGKK